MESKKMMVEKPKSWPNQLWHRVKNHLGPQQTNQPVSAWRFWSGVIATMLVVLYIELGRRAGFVVPVPFLILFASVVLAANVAGLPAGLISAAIAVVFIIYSATISFGPPTLTGGPFQVVLGALLCFTTAYLLGRTKSQNQSLIQQLQTYQESLESLVETRTQELNQANQVLELQVAERKQADKALRVSEERYHNLFDAAPISLWEEDWSEVKILIDGLKQQGVTNYARYFKEHPEFLARTASVIRILNVNSTTLDIYGATDKQDFINTIHQRLQQTSFDEFGKRLEALASGNFRVTTEGEEYRLDGTRFNIQITLEIPKANQGDWSRLLAALLDITERKQAEQELRESEARYRAIVEIQTEFVARSEPDGMLIFVNEAYCRQFGRSREQLLGTNFMTFLVEGDRRTFREKFAALTLDNPIVTNEHREYREDGSIAWYRWTDRGIFDEKGQLIEIQSVGRDITQRKQAEEALEQSEKYFRTLIENALDIITVLNRDGTIRYGSPSIERVLGYKPEELVGKNVIDFVHPDDWSIASNALAERSQIAGPAPPIVVRLRHNNGSWRTLEVIGNNLLDEPVIAGIVLNSRDITKRKLLEEQVRQKQKMEAIGQLTAGVAHDFNNLLLVINGFAELIHRDLSPADPHRESVEKILHAGQRASDLVRKLLAFSRKQIIEPRVLNLNTIVTEMNAMMWRLIGENIELETNLEPNLWSVKVDPTQLEQIIINLAINARDAMPEGGRLTIETANVVLDDDYVAQHMEAQPGEHVLLVVSDTGHGMSDEIKPHIFEPFFTTKEVDKGTGLGLATVYGIVRQSEGSIWVYSEEGIGTTFKIYLPREKEPASLTPQPEIGTIILRGNETILLVEDDLEVRDLVRRVLQEFGYTLLEAQHGQEALQLATNHRGSIHLLLTDVIMPGMSGKALGEQLTGIRPDLKVLFMSGYTENAIAHHGVLDPGVNLLQKPFSPTALARKVREVLDN